MDKNTLAQVRLLNDIARQNLESGTTLRISDRILRLSVKQKRLIFFAIRQYKFPESEKGEHNVGIVNVGSDRFFFRITYHRRPKGEPVSAKDSLSRQDVVRILSIGYVSEM